MAGNMTGTQVGEMVVFGPGTKHGQGRNRRIGTIGVVAATLALLLAGGVAMHTRSTPQSAAPAIPRAVTGQQTRFLENNTITLPNAVAPERAPVAVTSGEQRFLEMNTTTLPDAVAVNGTPSIRTQEQQRFWEVNTMLPEWSSAPYAEDVTPLPGYPR